MLHPMNRREFLHQSAGAALATASHASGAGNRSNSPTYRTANRRWQQAYDRALEVLDGNVQVLPRYDLPVLIEGAEYPGIWQECGPHESLVYSPFRPDVVRNSHMTFFALQRPDGQLPANNKRTENGFGQIQMVVPIAATAWEAARQTGDEELLAKAYDACGRWDDWLMRYRNTRKTGLVEGFCTYDTGHDNSPRWAGMPNQCPEKDAKICPNASGLPRLCPDLSATVYGGRVALAAMAKALGRPAESDRWQERADEIRGLILEKLFVPEDAAFYDLDSNGQFVRIRSDILSRVCGEHVVDQATFDTLWERQIHSPKAFWTPYPLPSIALDDPHFVRPIPRNSWGGASQALTALRAPRWLEYYGRSSELSLLMNSWCNAIQRDMTFRQQIDPMSGEFTAGGTPGYSPAALVMMDFTWRLAGVRELQEHLEWNVRCEHEASQQSRFEMKFGAGHTATLAYRHGGASLLIDGREILRMESGTARVISDKRGRIRKLVGIGEGAETVTLRQTGHRTRHIKIEPNQAIDDVESQT